MLNFVFIDNKVVVMWKLIGIVYDVMICVNKRGGCRLEVGNDFF